MIRQISYSIISLFFLQTFYAQDYALNPELNEISGLEFLNDTILVAHNDSGNSPHLYLLNLSGKIVKKVLISNAKNVDWEDIACDNEYLYIGDIGNNSNKRSDLKIYRVRKADLLNVDFVTADMMPFAYADQIEFPPVEKELNFDSECLIASNDELWIFTKNNSKPFNGNSKVYRFKFQKDSFQRISLFTSINFGNGGYYLDTPTAGDFQNDRFYFSTYNRWLVFELNGTNFKLVQMRKFAQYNQKEALTVKDSSIWVANEYNKILGKPKLKRIRIK